MAKFAALVTVNLSREKSIMQPASGATLVSRRAKRQTSDSSQSECQASYYGQGHQGDRTPGSIALHRVCGVLVY